MPEKHLFEYAIIRVMPRVERGEYLNVGVVVYCRKLSFLKVMITLDETRLTALYPDVELDDIRGHLKAFEQICQGAVGAGPIATADMAARFRWLTAKRSTVIQSSDVHPGLCVNAEDTLLSLHHQLVEV